MPDSNNPEGHDLDELMNSLDRKKDDFRITSPPPRDKTFENILIEFALNPESIDSAEGLAIIGKLATVNAKLNVRIKNIDESLLDALFEKAQSELTSSSSITHPTMIKILNEVDRKIEKKPEFMKYFISLGARCLWIGFRKGSKEFAGLEEILDGLHKKDIKIIAKGVVTFTIGPAFSTILFELLRKSNT